MNRAFGVALLAASLLGTTACPKAEECNDGFDNDKNGLIDCDDPACSIGAGCQTCGNDDLDSGEECDGTNFGDVIHCAFGDNGTPKVCTAECTIDRSHCCTADENCDDGIDDDCDGATDCDDSECAGDPVACPPTSVGIGHLYVAASDTSNLDSDGFVLQYEIGADGQLAPLTPASVAADNGSAAITLGADHAYVLNNLANTISQFSIGADGGVTALTPASVDIAPGALYLTLNPSGDTMFVPVTLADNVARYSVSNGALTALARVSTGDYPESACAAGNFLYIGNYEGDSISQFSIGAGGDLTPLTPATVAASGPLHCVTSPDSAHLYFTVTNGDVLQFAVGVDGTLSPLSPANVTTGLSPIPLVIDPTGSYVYAIDGLFNSIALFTRGGDGTLSAMSPATITTGAFPQYGAFDPAGDFFYLPLAGDNDIAQYAVSAAGLTPLATATVDTGTLSPAAAASRAISP